MNRNRGRGGGRPQGRGGLLGNPGRQRPQPLNSGAGILGNAPMGMGGNIGQFKQPQAPMALSPPIGRMQGMRPPQQQMVTENQNMNQMPTSMRESQLQMMNSLLQKQQQQQQQINMGRAGLLNNMENTSLMGSRQSLLDSSNLGDVGRSLPSDLISDNSYNDVRRSMPSDNSYNEIRRSMPNDNSYNDIRRSMPSDNSYNDTRRSMPSDNSYNDIRRSMPSDSSSGGNFMSQGIGRSLLDDNINQNNYRRSGSFDDDFNQERDFGGRNSLLGDIGNQNNLLSDGRNSLMGDNRSRSSLLGDDMNRNSLMGNSITTSSSGILDSGNLLSNMHQAVLGQNQVQGISGQGGSMQGIMGQAGNRQGIMGQQSGNMQGLMTQQRGNVQGIMGQQQQIGNMQGMLGQGGTNQNQGLLGPGRPMNQGIMGQRPQIGGEKPIIPSLFDVKTSQRGLLGKRAGRGGRDQVGMKRFRRNSGPSPQDNRRTGSRNDRGSDGRGRSRGFDHRSNRQNHPSSNDRRNRRDSDSARSHDSSRKSHSSDRKSHDKNKSHDSDKRSRDRSAEKKNEQKDTRKEEYDPAEPTEDDDVEITGEAWIEKKEQDVEITDLTKTPDEETVQVELITSTPDKDKDQDVPETTMTVTVDSKGRSVDDSALLKKESKDELQKKSNSYCHACMVECGDFEGFARHMKGKKHLNRMESLVNVHKQASEQQVVRMKAEEHLRTVEKKPRKDDDGKRLEISPRRGSTDRRTDRGRRRRRERDHDESSNASFPGDLGDMVTVDEVGFEEHEESALEAEETTVEETKKESKQEVVKKEQAPEDKDDYIIPDYDPKQPVGQKYVVPVSGYFCKLCHKFYTTEVAGKTTHCQSKQHYDKFHEVMMNKLMAKALCKSEEEEEKEMQKEKEKEVSKPNNKNEETKEEETPKEETNESKEVSLQNGKTEEEVSEEKMDEDKSTEEQNTSKSESDNIEENNENDTEKMGSPTNSKAKAVRRVAMKARRGQKKT